MSSRIKSKPVAGGFLARLKEASQIRTRIFVVMSGGACIEFRPAKDDAEDDQISSQARFWSEKAYKKQLGNHGFKEWPKSPVRVGMCYVASVLMVAGYSDYELQGSEIIPLGEPEPPLDFADWLSFASTHFKQFDQIMQVADRESVRAVSVSRENDIAAEKKRSARTPSTGPTSP